MINAFFLTDEYELESGTFLNDELKQKVNIQQVFTYSDLERMMESNANVDIVFTIVNVGNLESLYHVQMFQKKYKHVPLIAIFDTGSRLVLNESIEHLMALISDKEGYHVGSNVDHSLPIAERIDLRLQEQVKLTKRQIDVLKLLVYGKSNKQIARDLHLAEGTVKLHCMAIFKEIGVTNRTQAALKAEQLVMQQDVTRCNMLQLEQWNA